jgi:hypothetical protein
MDVLSTRAEYLIAQRAIQIGSSEGSSFNDWILFPSVDGSTVGDISAAKARGAWYLSFQLVVRALVSARGKRAADIWVKCG